ncbi:MAG: hypothetical protein HYY93_00705, partial [Planctomycetes bacterium]|nr:hypothetical protein [Planctomycetota bacterium]
QYAPIAANGTVGAWTATSAFPTARGYHTSVAYNGHLYVIGGSGGANLNDIQYAPIAANGTVGAWTATSAFPTARENHTSVAYNGYLYVIGGYGGAYLNDVQYAPINANGTVGAWTATATFPTARRAHTSAAANGRLYVIGGYSGAYQDDVQVAPIEGLGTVGAWTTTTAFTTARHGHTSVAYNGYLYVIGGNGGGNLNDVQYAPLNADGTVGAWAATTTFTTPREGHTSVAYNGHLYVIGGSNGSALNDVQYAPINANGTVGSWTGTTAFTTGRYSHTSVAHNGYLYLMGGYGGGYLSDAQYAPINADGTVGAWTTTTAFTTARAGHASVAYSGYMYVIGGTDGGGYFNDVQYAPINADGTVGAWTTTTAFATARDGHTSVAYNGYLYVIGGRDLSVWYGDVQRAPINANGTVGTWTATAAFTIAREDHTSAVSNGNLYVLGGQTPAYLNDVQVAPINPHGTVGAWAATTAFTTARRSHASVAYNGYVYVIGGIGGGYLNDVQYAPINANGTVGGWTATTPFTTARAAHTSVAYNGYLYVIGGNLTDVQFAPINANGTVGAWTATTALTTARDSHTSVAHNGYIYVMGGWVGGVAVNGVEYATINANGTLGAWTATTALMTARSSHTSVVYSGYLYVIGGDTGSGYLNDVQCAPIDANGTVGAWTPTTALSTVRSGPGSAVHNGYLYVMGGTSSGGQLNDVQVAPISANGTVGTWTTTLPFTTARSTPRPIAYNGYLYVIGGFDGVGNLNDVQFAPLLTPDPVGAWSKLVDLGGDVAVNSILVNGASANKGLVRLQYRLAPAATAVFGAETVVDPVTLGTPVSLATTARYVWTRVTLDDRNSAAINPDATNARDVTDIIVDYNTAPAAPTAAAQNKTTGGAVVATGGWTNESQIDLSATSSDADAPDTFKLQFEVRPVADAFTSPGTVVVDNIVFFESVPSASNTSQALTKTVTGLTNGALYHWQVRALDSSGAASAWVAFAGNTENPPTNPADTDFGVDTTAPTVTSVTSATANGNYGVGASIDVTVNFSESVTLTGGNLQVALDTGDVIAVTPFGPATSASGTYTVGAGDTSADLNATSPLTLSAGTLRDASSNDVLLTIPGGQSIADLKALVVDTTAPTVAVTPDGTTTSASPITFTLSFSEAVSGLLAGEVTVSNGTKGALAGGPTVYTIPVTPSAQGAVTCQVTASAAQDAAGNNNSVSNNASVTYDSIVPTVAVTPDGTSTSASSITFTMTFSEAVSGLLAGEVAITNGTAGALSGGPTVYTIPVTPSGQGAVTCQVTASAAQDAAGNNNTVSNNASVTYDSIAPTVAVTPDGTSTSASSITFTMTFSEAVTGLTAGEITLTNGTAGSLAGGPTVYTIPVTPTGQGAVTCQVIASAAQDAAGNNSTASNTANVTYDSVVPTVAVTPDGTTTNGSPITFTLTFSEAVSGLLVGEITATNGTAGALAGGPTVYTIPVTPTAQGSVTCQVIASATQDASGSGNTASNTASVTYDSIAPTAPGTPSASANPNNGAFTLTWSAATDTGGSGVASYTVERAPDGVTFAVIASGLTVTSLGEIGLAAGSYTYRIQAVDAAGNAGAYSALSATVVTETTPPAAVSDLTVLTGPPGTPTSFTLTLRWTAPGDDGSAGAAASYDLRYLTTGPVTSGNFASATPVSGEPAPSLAGSTEQITVSGLAANTTYFFGLVTVDDVGNTSGLSNATSQGTRVGVPQNLSAIANDGTIDLSWDPVSGAAGYLVSYGQDDGGPYTGTEASEGPSPVNVATTSITLHVPNNKQFYLVVAAYAPTTAETGDASLQIPALAHPASTQSVQTRAISGGTEATSYRMVGFPVLPADTNPIANLSDDFGPYDTRNWRLFGWIASTQEYEEVPATGSGKKMHRLRPGEGFWMISRADVVADVSGSLADMGVPFDIALEPGWNLIGHPFNFAVNWSDCTVNGAPMFSQSLMGVELWDFNGSYFVASQLTNGRGYFVKNLTASSITLSIPPVTASKPTWIDPAAIGVLYASSGPPPGPPAAINAEASGGGTATASSIAPTTVFSGGSGDGGAGSPSGGGGGGGGCFATRLASAAPGTAGLLALAFLAIGLGLRHAMDRSFRGA